MTPDEVTTVVHSLEATYAPLKLDIPTWVEAFARPKTDASRVLECIEWWLAERPERAPTIADIRWVRTTQLNPKIPDHIAEARAAIARAARPRPQQQELPTT